MIRDMKYIKLLSLVLISLLVFTGCKDGGKKKDSVVGEWELITWNEETPEFDIYISFAADGTFAIYQQVWSLEFELFAGNYSVSGDTVKGSYEDGSSWASEYKFARSKDTLTLINKDKVEIKSVYKSCTIPEDVISEATTTRSAEVVPFL